MVLKRKAKCCCEVDAEVVGFYNDKTNSKEGISPIYSYMYNGEEYESYSEESTSYAIMGEVVQLYVDPSNPEVYYDKPSFKKTLMHIIVGIMYLVVWAGLMVLMSR